MLPHSFRYISRTLALRRLCLQQHFWSCGCSQPFPALSLEEGGDWLRYFVLERPEGTPSTYLFCDIRLTSRKIRLCLSLGLLIIMHPNLRTRVVFTSALVPLITALTLVPYMPFLRLRHLVHVVTRLSVSAAGAFSVTFAVAILAREHGSPSWANVYDRLWVANGSGWGKSSERGFAALFCVLWVLGAGSDWALRRKLGDSVDEVSLRRASRRNSPMNCFSDLGIVSLGICNRITKRTQSCGILPAS